MKALLQILENISLDIRHLHHVPVKELENLVTAYPYYGYGHMLLAKKYKLVNSPQFEVQLAKAATYANNREELHQLMHTIVPVIDVSEKQKKQIKPKAISKAKSIVPKIKVAKPKSAKPSKASLKEKTTKKLKVQPNTVKPSVKKSPIVKIETKVKKIQTKAVKPSKPANKDKVVKLKPKKEKSTPSQNTFAGWLNDFKTEEKKKPKKVKKVKELKEIQPNFNKFSDDIDDITSFMAYQSKKGNSKAKLDKIIETNTSAYNLDEGLVTETYAKLLTKQGQYTKAIKSYELLQLKYPEKSGYFAGQIKKLKKK